MNRVTKIILLAVAYVLMLVAVAASFMLFGVQLHQNREDALQNAALRSDLTKQINTLQEENAAQSSELSALQESLAEKEQQIATLTAAGEQMQIELEASTEYGFDVTKVDAGTVVEAGQIDPENLSRYFVSEKIVKEDAVYNRIYGKSYVKNDDIGIDDLRYLKVLHYNFDHKIQVGEIIVNRAIASDVLEIFRELYENEYEIYSMYLIDNFWAGDGMSSDFASIDANNTSAFCYRKAVGSSKLSNHAMGRAIDINPQQNPYVDISSGEPEWSHENADDYIDRESGLAHVITEDDLAYKLFDDYGFEWGGSWRYTKDYQHFELED